MDLEVLVGTIGVLGVDRGSVSVNPRTTEVSGSYFVGPVMPADAGRSCVWAYIQFPVVPDAKQYAMHAFGFNDTLYWGTSIQESITTPLPPLPQFIGGSGVQGGNYYFFLTGGCGPNAGISKSISDMNARFVGMQVTVTVKF